MLTEKGPWRRVSSIDLAEYDMSHTSFNTALKQLIRKGALREDSGGNESPFSSDFLGFYNPLTFGTEDSIDSFHMVALSYEIV